jgi:hypothetical protein
MPPATTPRIRCCSLVVVTSIVRPTLVFCFVFILSFDVIYFSDSAPFIFSQFQACHHDPLVLQGFESSAGSILPEEPPPGYPTAASWGPGAQLVL